MLKKLINTKFKKDLAFSYFTQGITMSFGFIQLFLINRYFGIETFGQLAIIISTAGIFSVLLTARSSEAVTRFFTREMLINNLENAKFILAIGFVIDLVTALFLVLLVYVASDFVATTFMKDIKFSSEIFLYSFVVFFGFLRGTLFGYFQSKEMFLFMNSVTVFESFIKIIALVVIIFIFGSSSLFEIIMIFILASLMSFLYTLFVFIINYNKDFTNIPLAYNKKILKKYWGFNMKTFVSTSFKAGNQNIDILILSYFLTPLTIGIYQTIKKITMPILMILSPISNLMYPKFIYYFESYQNNKIMYTIYKIIFYSFIIIVLYGTTLYVFLEEFLLIMNLDYNSYNINIFLWLSFLLIFGSLMWWTRIFSNVINPMYSVYASILMTLITITVYPLLVYKYGLFGIFYGELFMAILMGCYWFNKLCKFKKGKKNEKVYK